MTFEEIKIKVREMLSPKLIDYPFKDDDDFFKMGLANSLFALQLFSQIESSFSVSIENEDLYLDNFRTVNAISQFIKSKMD